MQISTLQNRYQVSDSKQGQDVPYAFIGMTVIANRDQKTFIENQFAHWKNKT
jgi:hypothetical protein